VISIGNIVVDHYQKSAERGNRGSRNVLWILVIFLRHGHFSLLFFITERRLYLKALLEV